MGEEKRNAYIKLKRRNAIKCRKSAIQEKIFKRTKHESTEDYFLYNCMPSFCITPNEILKF